MYLAAVILLLFVLPVTSITVEAAHSGHVSNLLYLTGKWFTFWAVGIRLFIAGMRLVVQPRFTAQEIFQIADPSSFPIIREIGFANLSMGLLGSSTLLKTSWTLPAAIVGGLYYGFAGAGHIFHRNRSAKESTAMISDVFVFLILACFVVRSL